MYITCLDLEGVLVPEIWIAFSEVSGIPELRRTTRDEPDYEKLMRWRMDILRQHGLGLRQIQDVIAQIDPLPGAKEFLDELRATTQAVIVSDTFEEFAQPLMKKLGWPTIFCNSLEIDKDGMHAGPNFDQLAALRASVSCEIIASGGVSTLEDIAALKKLGIDGAIAGKAVYTGTLDLAKAIKEAE